MELDPTEMTPVMNRIKRARGQLDGAGDADDRRLLDAALARGGDRRGQQRLGDLVVPARRDDGEREPAGVDGALGAERRAGVIEIDQFAAVGEAGRALDHTGAEGHRGEAVRVHDNTLQSARDIVNMQ